MQVAIDTSVLIAAEKGGDFKSILPADPGPYYIPVHAAAEFLVGIHPPVRSELRQRAAQLYEREFKFLVSAFTEADAFQLSELIAELRNKGQTMGFFDAAIAATVIARQDSLLVADGDFDRLKERIRLLKP